MTALAAVAVPAKVVVLADVAAVANPSTMALSLTMLFSKQVGLNLIM